MQPGIYFTRGFNVNDFTGTWQPINNLRIQGSGQDVTTIQLCDNAVASKLTCAIGNDYRSSAPLLSGLEISDLTIDANQTNASTTDSAVGGIAVSGQNILIQRVHVKNLGGKGTGSPPTSIGISAARASGTKIPYNCVIADCRVDSPGGLGTAQKCIGLHFSSEVSTTYHEACTMRNCVVDFGTTNFSLNYIGVVAGGGRGTIIEQNQIRNCQYGRSYDNQIVTIDQIIRNNYFFNVATAIVQDSTVAGTLGRLIVMKNVIEWPTSVTTPVGIDLIGHGTSGVFGTVIVRENIFRRYGDGTPLIGDVGIRLNGCSNVTVENNVVRVLTANNAFQHQACGTIQVFNTRSTDGTFYPGYNSTTLLHDPELTTEVENALLAL